MLAIYVIFIESIPIILLTWLSQKMPVAVAVLGFFTFLHFAESKFLMLPIGDRMELPPHVTQRAAIRQFRSDV